MYEELVKRLRETTFNHEEKCESCSYEEDYPCCVDCLDEMHKAAADAIEELSDRNVGKWISVTEKLPEPDKTDSNGLAVPYLVMNGWKRVTAKRTDKYWVLFGTSMVLEYVTHWMPLPEPPKEET